MIPSDPYNDAIVRNKVKQRAYAKMYGMHAHLLDKLYGEQLMYIQPGVYTMKITEAQQVFTKANKRAYRVRYELEDGTYIYEWFVVPNSLWRFKKLFEALGIDITNGADTDDLINKHIKVRVENNEYNGHIYAKIIAYLQGLTPEQVAQAATLSPMELLKLVYPDKDVATLAQILRGEG